MRTLTRWEVEEFVEQALQRPTLWMGKDILWVRRRHGVNKLALKFVNGLPNDMSTLYVRVLDPTESEAEVERYVDWLLSKFTSYAWRMRVEEILLQEGVADEHVALIARRICADSSQVSSTSPHTDVKSLSAVAVVPPSPPVEVQKPSPLKSKYLQNLLRKR